MEKFAVIDTETNWEDRVMSIGTVIARADTFRPVAAKYHILTPEYLTGGIYSPVLWPEEGPKPILCGRGTAMGELISWFAEHGVRAVFAYNAAFDRGNMPELSRYCWYDIMRIAAYRQYNPRILGTAECCNTGRLKRGYGVEPMLRLLSGNRTYQETHNALRDALDELEIMRLLGRSITDYIPL